MIENDGLYSIGVVERDTGIDRDTLRVWERRYGFPEPVRRAMRRGSLGAESREALPPRLYPTDLHRCHAPGALSRHRLERR